MIKERLRGAIVRNLIWKKAPYYICPYYENKLICPPSFAKWKVRPDVWEPESRKYLEAHVRRGDVAVDVGAGIGHYTVLFSRLVGDTGLVYSYEPDPFMFKILEANIRLNGLDNVIISKDAISDKCGDMKFYVSTVGSSSLRPMCGLRSIITINTLTVDSLNLKRLDWVKIDTEGTEASILRGMRDTIERCNPGLLVEFIPELGPAEEILLELDGWNIEGFDNNIICEKKEKGQC